MLISAEIARRESDAFWNDFPNRIREDRVPPYTLPDPMVCFDGHRISGREEWEKIRRPELLKFYQEKLYGFVPPRPDQLEFRLTRVKDNALGGKALRKEYTIVCSMNDGRRMSFPFLLYLPRNASGKSPVFITMNFYGNHTTVNEPDIPVADHWLPHQYRERFQTLEQRAKDRGSKELSDRAWQTGCEEGLRRGYAVGTFCYECLMPDNGPHFEHSIYQLFHNELDYWSEKRDYGSIGAWTWGVSRVLDCLEQDPDIDSSRITVVGHSRLGKTALWAGVTDPRIALSISNNSGCCGAKLFHRDFGENLHFMAYWRPFWYSMGIFDYADREFELPVDQHELIGMIAPRHVYIASASEDYGADPKGEFLAAWHAGKIYGLYGLGGLECPEEYPEPGTVLHSGDIGYHLRKGPHSFTEYDWMRYFDYADAHL